MTIHTQPGQERWCFHRTDYFVWAEQAAKTGEYRSTCCGSGMYTASSALAGCLLHWSGQKVIPFSTNFLALWNHSSSRNTALSSHSTGDMMEKCLWDWLCQHPSCRESIQPKVFGKLQYGTDTSASGRCYWKDCFICKWTLNFRPVYLMAIALFAAVDLVVPVIIPFEVWVLFISILGQKNACFSVSLSSLSISLSICFPNVALLFCAGNWLKTMKEVWQTDYIQDSNFRKKKSNIGLKAGATSNQNSV